MLTHWPPLFVTLPLLGSLATAVAQLGDVLGAGDSSAAIYQPQEPVDAEKSKPKEKVDNLVHPPELETVEVGRVGRLVKEGRGPVNVVLLSGASFGASAWSAFMQRNLARYTMFAFTPAGYDGTPPPAMPEVDTIPDQTWTRAFLDAVVARLEEEGAESVIVIGHHMMGDYYAMRLTVDHPVLVRALILSSPRGTWPLGFAGTPGPTSREERWQRVEKSLIKEYRHLDRDRWNRNAWPADLLSRNEARGVRLYEHQVNTPRSTQLRYFLEYACDDLRLELRDLPHPTLLIDAHRDLDTAFESAKEQLISRYGDEEKARERFEQLMKGRYGSLKKADEMMSRTMSHELGEQIPAAKVKTIRNAGIFLMDDQAEVFDGLVESFVADLEP